MNFIPSSNEWLKNAHQKLLNVQNQKNNGKFDKVWNKSAIVVPSLSINKSSITVAPSPSTINIPVVIPIVKKNDPVPVKFDRQAETLVDTNQQSGLLTSVISPVSTSSSSVSTSSSSALSSSTL